MEGERRTTPRSGQWSWAAVYQRKEPCPRCGKPKGWRSCVCAECNHRLWPPSRRAPRLSRPARHRGHLKGEARGPLSPRQRQIMDLLCQGKSSKEIAWHLGISSHTVKNQLRLCYLKLQVHERVSAALAWVNAPERESEVAARET